MNRIERKYDVHLNHYRGYKRQRLHQRLAEVVADVH